ncbi:hypothetical protein CRUP_028723 [Coryphaenoides rupestris]|nr:hypothetical protein CRUP_028723 [Coryphaenoides rupestris]
MSPNEGHSKYMYLGQIHTGQDAVEYYTKGIEILLSVLEKDQHTTVKYSMEEGAADKCRESIERALHYRHDNPEALQLMASYLFSAERNQEGKDYLLRSVGAWLPAFKQAEASHGLVEEHHQVSCIPLQQCC